MNKVEQFCGQCAVATVAKDKRKKEGDHFNLIFPVGEKKGKHQYSYTWLNYKLTFTVLVTLNSPEKEGYEKLVSTQHKVTFQVSFSQHFDVLVTLEWSTILLQTKHAVLRNVRNKTLQNQKREIGNRLGPHFDKFNSSDNRNYQQSINKQKYSLSHIGCSYLIEVKSISVTDITGIFMLCP